jgi:hypothetical protein
MAVSRKEARMDPDLELIDQIWLCGANPDATIRNREITGASLKDAQMAIDRFAAGEPLPRPNFMGRR